MQIYDTSEFKKALLKSFKKGTLKVNSGSLAIHQAVLKNNRHSQNPTLIQFTCTDEFLLLQQCLRETNRKRLCRLFYKGARLRRYALENVFSTKAALNT